MVSLLEIKFFYQICALSSIETGHNIQSLIIKGKSRMEISSGIEVRHLCPSISSDIIHLALIHTLRRQATSNSKYLTLLLLYEHTSQRMRPPLKEHIPSLDQPLFHKLIATLSGLPGLTTSSKEYPSLFIFDGHEVGWDLDVNYVAAVGVGPEVIHEEVMSIVNEEVQGVKHLFVVAH